MNEENTRLTGDLALISKHRNALMGIAALIICAFHEFIPVFPGGTFLYDAESFVQRMSFYGVDIFMLLSGMSVATSLLKNGSVITFYRKRALRILPFYLLSGIVMIFLSGWTVKDYFLNIFGIRFFTESVNSYLWFVITIIIFYIAAPWYQKLIVKTGKPVVTFLASTAVWILAAILLFGVIRSDLYYFINRIPIFMLGMMIGNLIHKGYQIKYIAVFRLLVAASFIVGWLLAYMSNYYSYLFMYPYMLQFASLFCLGFGTTYLLAMLLNVIRIKTVHKVLEFFGSFCFEFYIVQIVFDARIHYFLQDRGIGGILHNLIMFSTLGLIAWASSAAVNWCVGKLTKTK
ncbi:MAG: acyltransferase [Clostridiales bacterium]|nr:acyltransferase [Clostridiales bacterium]